MSQRENDYRRFYIDGRWVEPSQGARELEVVNPATEQVAGVISMGGVDGRR